MQAFSNRQVLRLSTSNILFVKTTLSLRLLTYLYFYQIRTLTLPQQLPRQIPPATVSDSQSTRPLENVGSHDGGTALAERWLLKLAGETVVANKALYDKEVFETPEDQVSQTMIRYWCNKCRTIAKIFNEQEEEVCRDLETAKLNFEIYLIRDLRVALRQYYSKADAEIQARESTLDKSWCNRQTERAKCYNKGQLLGLMHCLQKLEGHQYVDAAHVSAAKEPKFEKKLVNLLNDLEQRKDNFTSEVQKVLRQAFGCNLY